MSLILHDWPVASYFTSVLQGFSLQLGSQECPDRAPLRAFIVDDNTRLVFVAAGLSQGEGESCRKGKEEHEVIISKLLSPDRDQVVLASSIRDTYCPS